jgi:CTP:phosphocholine cytidylyltransferase-like protein
VWDGCYERDIEKLEKIQLEAARIVTGLTKFACFQYVQSSFQQIQMLYPDVYDYQQVQLIRH